VPCPDCGGAGCEACDRRGEAMVKGCPQKEIGPDVRALIEAAGFAKEGAWPVLAGTQDQAAVFLKLCRIVWDREALVRAELGLPNG
jgi:hypothetical protein